MTRPRKVLISLADTPYYHVTSRCVRRAFLCGRDRYSGRNYEHRRQWVEDRVRLLASLFAIDVCAYAVMSNHYHLVLKICPDQLKNLSDEDIIDRWLALFRGPLLVQQYRRGISLSSAEQSTLNEMVSVWRGKLASISWFMRCLNQPIARRANLEDKCSGKFWECRFHSQALKNEEALLSCMAYVDLNPVRAGQVAMPEESEFTSLRERLDSKFELGSAIVRQSRGGDLLDYRSPLKPLLAFDEDLPDRQGTGIPCTFRDYLALIDWTSRSVRSNNRASVRQDIPGLLNRLQISGKRWRENATKFESLHFRRFNRVVPTLNSV